MSTHPRIETTDEVGTALAEGRPVVALESTIISHGMPYPDNVAMALEVEGIVREHGAVPATIAVLDGRPRIGLTGEDLELLASHPDVVKASVRDLPYVAARGLHGATTVAATMRLAAMAATTLALSSCSLVNAVLPQQQLQLVNRTTTSVVVRVAPFAPGQPYISDAAASQKTTLAAGKDVTLKLPTGHYGVYAELSSDESTSASSDVTLKGDAPATLSVTEHYLDHASTNDDPTGGSKQRQIVWNNS